MQVCTHIMVRIPTPTPTSMDPPVPRLLSCACAPQVLREHLPPLALRGAASALRLRLLRRRPSLVLPAAGRGFRLSEGQGGSAGHACAWPGGGGRFCLSGRAVSELSVCVCPYGIRSINLLSFIISSWFRHTSAPRASLRASVRAWRKWDDCK